MVIMLLDHTRDFIHRSAINGFDPTDLTLTSPALFFTRWVTHFCAPIFVFLAGTGAYLQLARGKTKSQLSWFLVTRGLWLIVLEFTVVRFAVIFSLNYSFVGVAQVIWAIGVSMIVLSALIYLPVWLVGAFGVAMIFTHNLLDHFHAARWQGPQSPVPGFRSELFAVLHQPGPFPLLGHFPGPVVVVMYPLLPWVGVMAAGYAFGAVYQMDAARRRRILIALGAASLALFVLLRATNFYGDPELWLVQKNAIFTLMSFLNVTKYPVSLLFLLMTLGTAFLFLALVEHRKRGWLSKALITFGSVPLFYYLLQWYTAHLMAVLFGLIAGQPVAFHFNAAQRFSGIPPDVGFNLWVVYVAWILGVVLLYPLCKWFADVKRRRRDWWLSYL
jgi:uncharacterized membrane protein